MKKVFCVLVLMLVFAACNPCIPKTMVCDGSKVLLCAPNKSWKQVTDCSKILRSKHKWCCKCEDKQKCGCKIEKPAKKDPTK